MSVLNWDIHMEKLSSISFWHPVVILGDPGAASRDDGIFIGESLQQERESPWALTLTERVPEAFEIPPSDWPEKYFSGQSAKRNSRVTLMSSYTRLFSSGVNKIRNMEHSGTSRNIPEQGKLSQNK